MKRPKKQPPANAPEGTVWFGGAIEWFSVALLVYPTQLPLARITQLLGCQPTDFHEKGDPILRADGTVATLRKVAMWRHKLSARDTHEWDICEAARLLLAQVNPDMEVWREITDGANARLSFGLSINASNRGFTLDIELMSYLADRKIEANFDVYTDEFEAELEEPPSPVSASSH